MTTKKKITKESLKKDVRRLERKIAQLNLDIQILKSQMSYKQDIPVYIPSVWSIPQCVHDFDYTNTSNPRCKKCGDPAPSEPFFTVTCSNNEEPLEVSGIIDTSIR